MSQGAYLWLNLLDNFAYIFAGLHAHMSSSHNIKALFAAEGMDGVCACEHCA